MLISSHLLHVRVLRGCDIVHISHLADQLELNFHGLLFTQHSKYPVRMLVRLCFATFGFRLSILKSSKFSLRTVIFSSNMSKKTAPYGTWKSPISSKLATESSVRFQEIRLDQKPGVVAGRCFIKFILIHAMYGTPK